MAVYKISAITLIMILLFQSDISAKSVSPAMDIFSPSGYGNDSIIPADDDDKGLWKAEDFKTNTFFVPKATSLKNYVRQNRNSRVISKIINMKPFNIKFNSEPAIRNGVITDVGKSFFRSMMQHAYDTGRLNMLITVLDDAETNQDMLIFLKYMISHRLTPRLTFWLSKFNNTGASEILSDSSLGINEYLKVLKPTEKPEIPKTKSVLQHEHPNGGVAFYAILKAAYFLPKDSVIVVFLERNVEDEQLSLLVLQDLLERNIVLYVVWCGAVPEGKKHLLISEIAITSGGKFIFANTERKLSKIYSAAYLKGPNAKIPQFVIAHYVDAVGKFQFPVDSTINAIHISLTSPTNTVILTSPQGLQIDLLNSTQIEKFSEGSFTTVDGNISRYDIHLNTADGYVSTPIVGLWDLNIGADDPTAQGCNVTVSVQTRLNITAYITSKYKANALSTTATNRTNILRVVLSGEVGTLKDVTIFNISGSPFKENVNFTVYGKDKETLLLQGSNSNTTEEVDVELKDLPDDAFFVRVLGQDTNGNPFSRLSYFDREKINYLQQAISVEVGIGSELLVMPNQQAKIFFEVTNNRDQVLNVQFMCQDEKSLLVDMQPRSTWLNPKQTAIVTVVTYSSYTSGTGFTNIVTLTVRGPEKVQKSAAMQIRTRPLTDRRKPRVWHSFTSDCTNHLVGKCEDGTWAVEVTAEDTDSGLLQLTSNPKGLYFPRPYVAGTVNRVTGIYGGSCCQPKIQVTAVDLKNNVESYEIDAYKAGLSAGSISAIALGVVLFILLIIMVIYACRKKCFKQKQSMDLPVRYRSAYGDIERY